MKKLAILYRIVVVAIVTICNHSCHNQPGSALVDPVESVQLIVPENTSAVVNNIAGIFEQRLKERGGISVVRDAGPQLKVVFKIQEGIGNEGFSIEEINGEIVITGNDERGLLYGVGKFLRTSEYTSKGIKVGHWRGKSIPQKEIRGIYWATHFYNYYQNAPVEELKKYVEDLGLWGYNNIKVWYDMHHFSSFNDPVAEKFRERIDYILQSAKEIGLGVSFTMIANEAYVNDPVRLRAVPGRERGAVYPEDICPHKPGGLEHILKVRGEFFDWSRQFNPDYITLWPYDPGGCASKDCEPWGSNGFLKAAEAVADLARQKLPRTRVILSTWMFDSTEWAGMQQQLPDLNKWTNVLMAEKIPGAETLYKGLFTPLPDNITVVGFPEISMYNTFPWGGFGANPFPRKLSQQWNEVQSVSSGGFPYSEGIFDDINKVFYAQLYWNGQADVNEIVSEYARYELGVNDTMSIVKVINTLEQNHHMRWWPGKLEGIKLMLDWFPSKNSKPQDDPGAEEVYRVAQQTSENMPEWAAKSWRWRILYIRTMLDAELKSNGGTPNEKCYEGFYELLQLYHCNQQTDPVVKPPLSAKDYETISPAKH